MTENLTAGLKYHVSSSSELNSSLELNYISGKRSE